MTPRQKELARHALGLPNEAGVSYCNQYYITSDDRDFPEWQALLLEGFTKHRIYVGFTSVRSAFYLTRQGALLALEPGERLNPKDFSPTEGIYS